MSKQKQLKKQGRGNKLRAYVSWTEIFIIFVCPLEVNSSSCLVFILQGKCTLPFLVAKAYLSIIFCNIDLESLCNNPFLSDRRTAWLHLFSIVWINYIWFSCHIRVDDLEFSVVYRGCDFCSKTCARGSKKIYLSPGNVLVVHLQSSEVLSLKE